MTNNKKTEDKSQLLTNRNTANTPETQPRVDVRQAGKCLYLGIPVDEARDLIDYLRGRVRYG
jgi:hypothetical protein